MEVARAVPDGAVQETSFENDTTDPNAGTSHQDAESGQDDRSTHRDTNDVSSASITPEGGPCLAPDTSSKLAGPTKAAERALAPDLLRGLLVVLMVLDHNSILSPWPPSFVLDDDGEWDNGVAVHTWNKTVAYVIRLLTSPWPPGLLFLFGTGIVYFGQSRRALGWTSSRMARHFTSRAVILAVLAVLLGVLMTLGRVWFMSHVLFALAVDYLLAGILWLAVLQTEETLAYWLLQILPDDKHDDAREPLLADRRGQEDIAPDRKIMRAADISWHFHNGLLLTVAVVAISWNIWRSPTGGHCQVDGSHVALDNSQSSWLRIWIDVFVEGHVASLHPPLAWLSFVVLGLLYGRIIVGRTWTRTALTLGNVMAGLALLLVFVLTRLLHFGNLSEECLQMPEHKAKPNMNQYLASWRSFLFFTRFPPDVAHWAYGAGVNFILLSLFGTLPRFIISTVFQPLQVFGTSALFSYVTHLLLLFISWSIWSSIYGLPMSQGPWSSHNVGFPNDWVFLVNWAVELVILYPLCMWYGTFKKAKGPDSIWRAF